MWVMSADIPRWLGHTAAELFVGIDTMFELDLAAAIPRWVGRARPRATEPPSACTTELVSKFTEQLRVLSLRADDPFESKWQKLSSPGPETKRTA